MNDSIMPIPLNFSLDDWQTIMKKPLPQRDGYKKEENNLTFGQVAARMLGTHLSEDQYLEELYDAIHSDEVNVHLLNEELDKSIDPARFQSIQRILMIHQEERLSVNRFLAFLDGERLIPQTQNRRVYFHLRNALMTYLQTFEAKHAQGMADPGFRRAIVDMVKWLWNHLDPWLNQNDFIHDTPQVIWYGDASESESYFLYYLILVGCDVLIFHPEGKDILQSIDEDQKVSKVLQYPSKGELQPFPKTRPVRKSTVAYRASQEIDKVMHSDGSMLYKPWQFRNYDPVSVTLKTTYDELFILIKEKSFIRPNFDVSDKKVHIPALFAKVQGISKNRKQYWDRIQTVADMENALTIRRFPFTKEINANLLFHYRNALNPDGILEPEQIIHSNWWKYKELPSGLQLGIASAISRYCAKPRIKPLPHEKMEQLQLFLFAQAMAIPEEVSKLLQRFDYAQDVPKLILYNTEKNGKMSRCDAALIALLNEIGIDIVIFNPPGQNDIELYMDEKNFDTHWLEEVSFEEEFKEASVFKKIIKKIF
ncbi:YceG family protein [Falsibacillus pallidus]|uniref:YceG family protein n=1 Tax=Falsibacillus pallidus TaxID=493781 RepID=UPI003D953081